MSPYVAAIMLWTHLLYRDTLNSRCDYVNGIVIKGGESYSWFAGLVKRPIINQATRPPSAVCDLAYTAKIEFVALPTCLRPTHLSAPVSFYSSCSLDWKTSSLVIGVYGIRPLYRGQRGKMTLLSINRWFDSLSQLGCHQPRSFRPEPPNTAQDLWLMCFFLSFQLITDSTARRFGRCRSVSYINMGWIPYNLDNELCVLRWRGRMRHGFALFLTYTLVMFALWVAQPWQVNAFDRDRSIRI